MLANVESRPGLVMYMLPARSCYPIVRTERAFEALVRKREGTNDELKRIASRVGLQSVPEPDVERGWMAVKIFMPNLVDRESSGDLHSALTVNINLACSKNIVWSMAGDSRWHGFGNKSCIIQAELFWDKDMGLYLGIEARDACS